MKALVFEGPGRTVWQDVPDPALKDPADVIVRVDAVTICGTDLHIVKGDLPEVVPGRVLGHEAVGTVVESGGDVRSVHPGDRVLVSCISSCGRCRFCRESRYGQCRGGGGWVLGHTIDGTQAEYVRVPFADLSVYPLPSTVDSAAAVLLADILPTSYEVGVLNGNVRPGDTVVVVGAGPIGLAAIATARPAGCGKALGGAVDSDGYVVVHDGELLRLRGALRRHQVMGCAPRSGGIRRESSVRAVSSSPPRRRLAVRSCGESRGEGDLALPFQPTCEGHDTVQDVDVH
ncbi:alcohol dehydrogenase catalytic domain-containing protein [Streptomyces sp. NPDC058613]|uniref:alcohol dehydrogenase catalytic domain-containing protein n=1 Tax=unclassified Streptomyces TaxID=2593676 RepID=UPI00365392ED